ncbi:hypothetical protein BaOVIS_015290 [Babesia ovis]|uniref:Uncharacterized protein n=1 Tax=Babesia ovis TaxID=5869 RepID=A0A9W5TAW5_BABOV|nr:hypothetical protein BaOVIS_015290 [Babesia ovis]
MDSISCCGRTDSHALALAAEQRDGSFSKTDSAEGVGTASQALMLAPDDSSGWFSNTMPSVKMGFGPLGCISGTVTLATTGFGSTGLTLAADTSRANSSRALDFLGFAEYASYLTSTFETSAGWFSNV